MAVKLTIMRPRGQVRGRQIARPSVCSREAVGTVSGVELESSGADSCGVESGEEAGGAIFDLVA